MTRFAIVFAAAAGAVLFTGCVSPRAPRDGGVALVNVGEKAADIENAVAMNLAEEIKQIEGMRREVARKREQLIDDAWAYGDASADAWSDYRIARRDRPAVAQEYASWSHQRTVEQNRYRSLGRSYESDITLVEGDRIIALRNASCFASLRARVPQ